MKDFLDTVLFNFKGYQLKVETLIILVVFCLFVFALLRLLKFLIYRSKKLGTGEKFSINKLTSYVIAVIAFLIALQIVGIDITVLLATSAALLVGIGFGLQTIFSDFVSGIIILLEGSLKVDDVVEVNGKIYMVEEIKFRTTTVVGRDENYVILPNSYLTTNSVVNWTYNRRPSRFQINVGVDYATNVQELMDILTDVAKNTPRVLQHPEPFVRFEDYGDSSINFSVYFYTYEIFRAEQIKSIMRVEIFKKLNEHNINIPFPQRVIRYHEPPKE